MLGLCEFFHEIPLPQGHLFDLLFVLFVELEHAQWLSNGLTLACGLRNSYWNEIERPPKLDSSAN